MSITDDAPQRTTRTRTIEWEDPLATLGRAEGLSGLEYLQAMSSGELPPPPIAQLLGFEGFEAEEGVARFFVVPGEHHYNPIGVVHGGLAATLLDSAMGCAVQSTLPAGVGYTTLEVKVNYVRAMTAETGRVTAEARVLHVGGRVATAEGGVTGPDGKLLAHGTTTCLVMR